MPEHINAYVNEFDNALTESEFNDPRFAYRVLFVPKTVNHKGQADQVIEFVKADSDLAKGVNKQYAVVKETEKTKYLPKQVVEKMQVAGFKKFNMNSHTELWKAMDAKNLAKALGVQVVKTWYWYEPWIQMVHDHCIKNSTKFK